MRRSALLATALLGALIVHLAHVAPIDAQDPPNPTAAAPQYEYDIVSGLRPLPTEPHGDVRLSDGWHDMPEGSTIKEALDFAIPTGVNRAPVHADIRHVSGAMLTATLIAYYYPSPCTGRSVLLEAEATNQDGAPSGANEMVAIVSYGHVDVLASVNVDGEQVKTWPLTPGHAAPKIGEVLAAETTACEALGLWTGAHLHQRVGAAEGSSARIWRDTTIEERGTPPYAAAVEDEYKGVADGKPYDNSWMLWRCVAPSRPFWKISTHRLTHAGTPPNTFVVTRNCHILTIAVEGKGDVNTRPPAHAKNEGAYHDENASIRMKPSGVARPHGSVTLEARSVAGYRFAGWAGTGVTAGQEMLNPASVTMTQDWTLTATFELNRTPSFDSEGVQYQFTVQSPVDQALPEATDGDGALTYELLFGQPLPRNARGSERTTAQLPDGLMFNAAERRITGTPTTVTPSRAYTLRASDVDEDVAELSITIEVTSLSAATDLSGLSLSGVTLGSTFDSNVRTYAATAPSSRSQTTVTATPTVSTGSVSITPVDAATSTAGHQVNLASGATTTITVTVTAADGIAMGTYTVGVTRASPPRPPPLPTLTITGSVRPSTCLTGGAVTIRWQVHNARGAVSVQVGGNTATGDSVGVTCMDAAGRQSVTVTASDSGPPSQTASVTVRWTVNARSGVDCLSHNTVNTVNTFTVWRADCTSTTAATLLNTLDDIGACGIWLWQDPDWVGYSVTSDGTLVADSVNFTIAAGDLLWIGGCDASRGGAIGPPGPPPNLPKS